MIKIIVLRSYGIEVVVFLCKLWYTDLMNKLSALGYVITKIDYHLLRYFIHDKDNSFKVLRCMAPMKSGYICQHELVLFLILNE